jgi:hypothetical protein
LDKSLDYKRVLPKRYVRGINFFRLNQEAKRKVWFENFVQDFPDYKKYVSCLKTWKLSGLDAEEIKLFVSGLGVGFK